MRATGHGDHAHRHPGGTPAGTGGGVTAHKVLPSGNAQTRINQENNHEIKHKRPD